MTCGFRWGVRFLRTGLETFFRRLWRLGNRRRFRESIEHIGYSADEFSYALSGS